MAESTRAQLEALKDSLIRSDGVGGKTTAEDLRVMLVAIINSQLNIIDDADQIERYLQIDTDGRVDVSKINSVDSGTIKQVLNSDGIWKNSHSGVAIFNGTGVQTTFTVTHNSGFTPQLAIVTPGTTDSAKGLYTNNYTATTFDVVYLVAPTVGTGNLIINFLIE